MQTPARQMTTSLWKKETVCVCVIVLSVAWGGAGGHLGFLQPAKQMQSGRFTSPSGQAENIHTVGHSTKKTLPKEMKRFLDICLWSRSKLVTVSLDPVAMAKSQNGRSALQRAKSEPGNRSFISWLGSCSLTDDGQWNQSFFQQENI